MNATTVSRLVLYAAFALAIPMLRAQEKPLDVRLSLSKTEAMLGEPLWIDVTATNRGASMVAVDWGAECFSPDNKPLVVRIPEAVQVESEPKNCGNSGMDCAWTGSEPMQPVETVHRRFALAGDFQLTRPGEYTVLVQRTFWLGPALEQAMGKIKKKQIETARLSLTLTPPDPTKLLAEEQSYAAEVLKPYVHSPMNVPSGLSHEAYMRAVRAWSDADRRTEAELSRERYALFAGLAQFPVAGMESVFESWETPPRIVGYGTPALRRLNTPEAREALARLAVLPMPASREAASVAAVRMGAVDALSRMGDRRYLPLLEREAYDTDRSVRMLSVLGLGRLGGEAEVAFLDSYARKATDAEDRRDAIQALSFTKSARAVPLLIALFTEPVANEDPSYWLFSLTHHEMPATVPYATPAERQNAWRAWWEANKSRARMFGPEECVGGH